MTENQRMSEKYLLQIRNTDKEINDMILRVDYLRYLASGAGAIRYDKDRVQTSPEDLLCKAVTEAIALEGELYDRHKQLMKMREHTEKVISLWNDNNARFIDIYYLSRGSMTDVARRIGCSDRNAYFIKLKALEEFAKYCDFSKNNT